MASSFIDDLLGKKIDENEVSAMKGSLESQLASSTVTNSTQNEVKPVVSPAKSTILQVNVTTQPPKQSSPILSQTANLRSGIPAPRAPVTTTVIHIAPRPTPSTAVPLAPRPNTMTVLSPGAGGRYVINAADLLNRNVNVINASRLLAPRMVTGVAVPGQGQAIAPRIIQQIQPALAGVPMGQARPQNPGVQISTDSKTGRITLSQAPIHSAIVTGSNNTGVTYSTVPRPSLQVQPSENRNSAPANVAFRMPNPVQLIANQQANMPIKNSSPSLVPTSSKPSITAISYQNSTNTNTVTTTTKSLPTTTTPTGVSQVPVAAPQAKAINAHLEAVKEQAAKLKNFFNNLIRLASEKSPEVGPAVKDLIQKVMEGKLTEDEFASKLLTTLSSGPQPNLVGFLKKALPMLRAQAGTQILQIAPQQQQQPPQTPQQQVQIGSTQAGQKMLYHTQTAQSQQNISSPQQRITTPVTTQAQQQYRVQLTPQQQLMLMQKQSVVTLTPAQQQLLQRQQQITSNRVLIASSSAGGSSVTQVPARNIVMLQAARQGASSTGGMKTVVTQSKPHPNSAPGADKSKHKPGHAGISSSGDDDINDVTSMAGVNLMEESQRILAINSELLSSQTRSCRDELFLYSDPLQKKLELLVRKRGITGLPQDVCGLISHATQERLRDILEKLSVISLNRPENYRDDPRYETISETKAQIRVFEQIDEVERKKRDLREREVLMRAAKSRSRQEDPEQARLKEKAKQLQQEEEEIIRKREANNTALAAIGPRKKRKLDEALEGYNSNQGSSSTSTTFNSPRGGRPQRTRRITLKDLVFVLEQERESSKSSLLYKAFLK